MISTTLLAVGLQIAALHFASAADPPNAALSPGEAAPSREQGIVGDWSFNEGTGNAVKDGSKNSNDGAITGAKWAKGIFGSALEFNGVNDYVNMRSPGNGITDKAVSVEAWIQSTGNNVNANLVFAGPEGLDFGIWIQGGRFFAGVWNSEGTQYSAISPSSPTPDLWYHVAMTCDFNTDKIVRFYVNGILNCTSTAVGTAIRSGHTTIDVGGRTPNASYFKGIIDEVKIYNRALTEEEIRKPYANYLKKRSEEINTAAYKNSPWIWTNQPEDRTAYFRNSFTVPDITGKKVFMVSDGYHYQVFLNGKAILPCKDYSEAQIVEITKDLKAGKNVIAAQASNKGENIGFFAYIGYPSEKAPEGFEMLASGEGMKCSSTSPEDHAPETPSPSSAKTRFTDQVHQFSTPQPAPGSGASMDWHCLDFNDSKWTLSKKIAGFDKSLAIERNFPDLGLYFKDIPKFSPPDLENGKTMQFSNSGLSLVLQYAGKKHNFQVEDSVTHEKWFMPGPPFLIDDYVSAWDGDVSCNKIDNGFKVTASGFVKYPGLQISYSLVLKNRALEVTLEPIQFPSNNKALSISFPLDFGAARAGEDGYLVNSYGNYDAREGRIFPFGVDCDRYRDSGGLEIRGESTMPFFGIVIRDHPCAAIITDFPATNFEFRTSVRQNSHGFNRLCSTTPIWSYDRDRVNEARHITYQFLKKGGYVEVAKAYRRFLLETGRYATLRERVRLRPISNLAANASFFWSAYSLTEMPAFMANLKESGVNKAVLQVANKNDFVGGWRRWPEGMTPESGTTAEFTHVANVARQMGYGFSPVDEYTPFADRGKDYDASLRAMTREGGYYSFEKEKTFFLCDSQKLRFAQRDLPHVKEVIGECPYLLDCEGCSIYDCFDPRHPLTSRQQILARREFLTYVRNTMGSVVSEGSPMDWLTDIIDVGHGHSIGFKYWDSKPGEFIPLWSLVYGGAVVDLFRVADEEDGMLYAALYGLNARFDDYKIGTTELAWHHRISDAWPERNFYELSGHQFLAPLVQISQFKENAKMVEVIANFGDVAYPYQKQVIPPHDFKVLVGGKSTDD